ncbi:hypothetical protein DFH08DRAFT_974713 [Mycena albidolilacea]|uniref:F-box domain-containing protein n=1 Tax=Mycena albidolilacea TaxID=1033008 RepID=A0AAD6Z668_9AGAR|nr:hypothetical protein DFH08DRAFT_974713 [Mycena albidolilacea]
MRITHLGADVLSEIFLLNEVYTILSLSRVHKCFHVIAHTRHLWFAVIRRLHRHGLLDTPPDEILETFSKAHMNLSIRSSNPRPSPIVVVFDENPEKPESESSVEGWSKKGKEEFRAKPR